MGFPGSSVGKKFTCKAGDTVNPWVAKMPWRRKWQTFHYSCLGNPVDRGAWQAIVHGVTRVRHVLATKLLLESRKVVARC